MPRFMRGACSPLELVEDRGWSDTNPCSRCGSRLSDYADGMAHGRVERDSPRTVGGKRWDGRHLNSAADISTGTFYNPVI